MEVFNCVIQGTNNPEVQEILKNIDCDTDILITSVNTETSTIEIQYIEPINQLKTLGFVPQEIATEIIEKYGDNSNVDIADFLITFENGLYGVVVDIEVDEIKEEEPKEKRLPLPLLVVVGSLTALLTLVLVIIKIVKSFGKKE